MPHGNGGGITGGSQKECIAIMGAGICGAYLHRLLKNKGISNQLFDPRPFDTRCGLTPCAWGTSSGFESLILTAGLDPRDYILKRIDHLYIDEIKVEADLMTIDKPRLVADLIGGDTVHAGPPEISGYKRLVDATGTARAYLPPISGDLVMGCAQVRANGGIGLANRVKLGAIGYAWCFPLDDDIYHVGCGSFQDDPRQRLSALGWLKGSSSMVEQVICSCRGRIRLGGPGGSLPFFSRGPVSTWGVGEAIGCVAPLAGDGILPGLQSVHLLLANWHDPDAYTRAILRHFKWMEAERRVLDHLRSGRFLGLSDAWVLKKNSRRMGMRIGIRDALRLLRRLKP